MNVKKTENKPKLLEYVVAFRVNGNDFRFIENKLSDMKITKSELLRKLIINLKNPIRK